MAKNNQLNTGVTPLIVGHGGSGASTFSNAAPICGGTTSTGAFQGMSRAMLSGDKIVSAGASALPTLRGGMRVISVDVSASQIIGMYTTKVTIIPAVGTGKSLFFYYGYIQKIYNSSLYTGGGEVRFLLTGTSGGSIPFSTFSPSKLGLDVGAYNEFFKVTPAISTLSIGYANNGSIALQNLTAAFAGGNSTLRVHLYYFVMETA